MKFSDFNFDPNLVEGLDTMGYKQPTPIQEQAIPIILRNKDIIACAQTGTGKTAAFLLPVINNLLTQKTNHETINTLVIAPTRELAIQIDQQVEGFSYFAPVVSIPVYGGGDGATWDQQKKALVKGADIVIATPGRLIAHMNMGYINFNNLKHLILDEADRMLDMGFYEDIMMIVKQLPKDRQTLLFSATMPSKIRKLAKEILNDPEELSIAISKPAAGILQAAYLVYDNQKNELVKQLVQGKNIPSILIFSSTKSSVKILERELKKMELSVAAMHSDLQQSEREEVFNKFKARNIQVLVATDIVSRGIDVDDIGLVINYDVPNSAEDYVHRIGRTARAESTGVAITFINDKDQYEFSRIEEFLGKEVVKSPLPASYCCTIFSLALLPLPPYISSNSLPITVVTVSLTHTSAPFVYV